MPLSLGQSSWLSLATVIGLSLTACSTGSRPPQVSTAPSFEKGMELFPSPRSFDGPGTIFRVDPDGVRRAVVDLSGMLMINTGVEAIPTLHVTGRFDVSALLRWLGTINLNAQVAKMETATVWVGNARRELAYEAGLNKLLDSANVLIDWTRPGRLYLITETISADTVDIHLEKSLTLAIGDTLNASSAVSRGISVRWDPNSTAQLSMRFPHPLRVYYKADQLVRNAGALENDSLPQVVRLPASHLDGWFEP